MLTITLENGEKLELNYKQYREVIDQLKIMDAINVLEIFEDSLTVHINDIPREELLKLGYDLEEAIYSNCGDCEAYVLIDYGYLKN